MAHYKLCIYGEPAVGKSVFALGFPNPFFICTDENYDFLKVFGAKDENHVQVHTWAEFKSFIKTFDFKKYDTIVVDLMEDLYMWAESEYCRKNGLEDISDLGYGKGYKIVRNDYSVTMISLINQSANFVGLTHEDEKTGKTNRGVDYVDFAPSTLIPEKCWTLIQGKLHFFFRAHIEETTSGDRIVRKRLLSVSPKPHEFQINRGMNVDELPDDIELSAKAFFETFGKPDEVSEGKKAKTEKAVEKPVEKKESSVSDDDFKEIVTKAREANTKKKTEEKFKQVIEPILKEERPVEVAKPVQTNGEKPVESTPVASDKKKDGYAEIERIKAILANKKKGAK